MGNQREVVALLDRPRREERKPSVSHRHHIRMVPKHGNGLTGNGAGCHMEDARMKFACDFVHVRDHQKETLGGSEGGRKRPSDQRAMECTGHTELRLHDLDLARLSKDIRDVVRGHLLHFLSHRGGSVANYE